MQLVSCPECRTQYDVTGVTDPTITCSCGQVIYNRPLRAVDATIERCGSCGAAIESTTARCGYCSSPIARDATNLSLICPECFARNRDSASFCTHCGIAFAPQIVVLDGEELGCPACEHALLARAVGGLQVHECPHCKGIWAPGESFDAIVEKAIAARRSRASEGLGSGPTVEPAESRDWSVKYRKCPVCEGHMQRKNYGKQSGVIVDWCGEHGTWLDADELGAIAAFIMQGGLERSASGGLREMDVPASADEARALAEAERIMAGDKMAQAKRRARLETGGGLGRSPILEFFEALLRA